MPLSDEEFNDLLQKRLAAVDAEGTNEEDGSELLSEEEAADLAIMREALGNYKAEALAWAEKQSATMPSPRPSPAVALWDRAPRWALAGVATAACAVGAVTFTHVSGRAPTNVATAPTAQVLAADNQLLSSVDDALAGSSSTPTAQELGLSPADLLTGANDVQKRGRTQNATN